MAVHTVEIHQAELESVPLFPLPEVVLFPGAYLPLHVFEPRYRRLVEDVMKGSRLLCVPRLQGKSGQEPAPIAGVSGLGRIVQCKSLEDDRYNILLLGLCRVGLVERASDKPYRLARVELLTDREPAEPFTLPTWYRQFRQLVTRLLPHCGPDTARQLRTVLNSGGDSGSCADQVAAAAVANGATRQKLLEERDPVQRLALVVQALAEQLARVETESPLPPTRLN